MVHDREGSKKCHFLYVGSRFGSFCVLLEKLNNMCVKIMLICACMMY